LKIDDAVGDVPGAQRNRLSPKSLEQAVRIAPAVAKRMHATAQIVDVHRWKSLPELARRQKLDFATVFALDPVVGFEQVHAFRPDDEQIPALDPVDRRVAVADCHLDRKTLDEISTEQRHRDVLGTGEQDAHATRRAQRRGELVGRVGLDDAHRRGRRERLQEIRSARSDDAAAQDRGVVVLLHEGLRIAP